MKFPMIAGLSTAAVLLVAGSAAAGSSIAADRDEPSVPPETIVTEPGTNGAPLERPDLVKPTPEPEPVEFPVNAKGETYGSNLYAMSPEEEPDLISAVASNGKSGYVRAIDLEEVDPSPANPAEAVKHKPPVNASVPVYESDGVTVVGTFPVGPQR